jgi:regulator of RNase E activity RraA
MDPPMPNALTTRQFEFLHSIDTPTACNLIEVVTPNRRGFGYTVKHLHCPFPDLPPIVGYAKTVKIKSRDPFKANSSGYMAKRLDYLDYVAAEPQPSISVIEDTDGEHVGYGAFWGEVQTNVHKALGVLGVVTNGSVRDIPMVVKGFQILAGSIAPSHAFVHIEEYGTPVNVHGMTVESGDLIHADRHGAVVVLADKVDEMMKALEALVEHEAGIIRAANDPSMTIEKIKKAIQG